MSVKEPTIEKENTEEVTDNKNNSSLNEKINVEKKYNDAKQTLAKESTSNNYTFKPSKARNSNYSVGELFGLFIMIFFILVLLIFIIFTIYNMNNQNIVKGVSILGIDISGLSKEDATEKINNTILENIPSEIKLKHNDYETSIDTNSLEISIDVPSAVNSAYNIGRSGNILQDDWTILTTMFSNVNIEPVFNINEEQLKTALNDISTKLPDAVIQSSYYIEDSNLILTKGKTGNVVNVEEMSNYIINEIKSLSLKDKTLEIITQEENPSELDIDAIHSEIYKEASNAYYTQNPYAVYPSENGLDFAISIDEAKALLQTEQEEYTIPLKTLYPEVTTNMIGTEAFPDLLSTFKTTYSTRDRDRTTNLTLAANKINGTVVMPGETFSYNTVVGERTIAAGYKEAPIYVSGEVVDGLGGGICQITSTLYNAVVYANLEIVERSNHQFVPSYVSASRDATVVYGSIDFKFKNNRDYPIKLVCSVSNGVAKFDIYGLKTADDYDVEISSRITSQTSTSTNSEAYKILKKNGQIVSRTLLSRDTYKRH